MLRPVIACPLASCLLAITLLTSQVTLVRADEPTDSSGAVEKLRSLLHSIDPYHSTTEVSGKVELFGSGAMDGLAHAWGDSFRQFHPDIEIEVTTLNDEKGGEQMVAKPHGIWMLSRPVNDEELEALKSKGLRNPVVLEVARQALGVFVHASNPVETISGEQMKAVFSSATNTPATPTWTLLGATGVWANRPIEIISRQSNSGTQRFLRDVIFRDALREGQTVDSNASVIDVIKANPLAIGFSDLRRGAEGARALRLEVGGKTIPNDDLAILTGQYPLIRPLSIVIDLDHPNNAQTVEFVRYVFSQAGQAENVLAGYFPVDLPLIRAELVRLRAK